jgi:hypothetical protein
VQLLVKTVDIQLQRAEWKNIEADTISLCKTQLLGKFNEEVE